MSDTFGKPEPTDWDALLNEVKEISDPTYKKKDLNATPSSSKPPGPPPVIDPFPELIGPDRINAAMSIMDRLLSSTTGHNDYNREKIGLFAIATFYIKVFDPFPCLAVFGPPATGKTQTLDVLRATCNRVVFITGSTITPAAFEDSMAEANNGTLVVEEAEKLTRGGQEDAIITRYSRSSAVKHKMVKDGDDWVKTTFNTYGATVFHRRNPFRDPALTRRVISVRTIRVKKLFKVLSDAPELFNRFKQLMVRLPALPEPKLTWDCEPGILDCYRPIIALAEYIGDKEFLDELKTEVTAASNRLREEESFLEGPTFLKALIALANERVKDAPSTQPIGIEIRQLDPAIAAEFGADSPALQLSSNQRNSILREFGFSVRSSGGRYRVFLNIPQLIQVCDECNVEDDLLDAWAIILNLKRVKPQVPGVGETDMGQEGKSEGNSKAE